MRQVTAAILFLFVLLTVEEAPHGQQRAPGYATVYGAGVSTCGKWLQQRMGSIDDWAPFSQWVLGWVSSAGHYG
jgi:hypothetical protein